MTNFLLHMDPGRANFLGHVAMGYCFFFLFQSVFIQCEMDPILIRVFDVRCLNSATSCCYRCGVKQFECEAPKVNIFIFLFPFFFFVFYFIFVFVFFEKNLALWYVPLLLAFGWNQTARASLALGYLWDERVHLKFSFREFGRQRNSLVTRGEMMKILFFFFPLCFLHWPKFFKPGEQKI